MSIATKSLINVNICLQVPQQKSFTFQVECPQQSKINMVFSQIFIALFKNKSAVSALTITEKDKVLDSNNVVKQNETYYAKISKQKYDELVLNMAGQDKKQQVIQNVQKQPKRQKKELLEKKEKKNEEENQKKERKQKKQMQQKIKSAQLIDLNSHREKDTLIQNTNPEQDNTHMTNQSPVKTMPTPTTEGCCQLI